MRNKFKFSAKITFTAIGAYIEEFITELVASGIKTYEIRNIGGMIHITIKRTEYKKAAVIASKYSIRIRVNERHGLYFNFGIIKRYTGIIIGTLTAFIIVLLMQNFIWKIEVHDNSIITENQILKAVAEYGLQLGANAKNININSVEVGTKLALKDISWINVEINGSRADIYINEGINIEKSIIDTKAPCNVIAGKSGIIVETEVYSGTLVYNKGSGVSEGAIIVSGVVNDGADNLLFTHANAKIIAEFTENVEFRQEFTTTEKILSKIIEQEKELMLFGFVIPISDTVENTNNKICDERIDNCSFLGFKLPWKIKTNTYTAYEEIAVTRTYDDVNRLLEQKFENYCKDLFFDYEILDVSKKFEYDEKGITLKAEIKLKGNIAIQQEIMRKTY